jgi:hypothetical protein
MIGDSSVKGPPSNEMEHSSPVWQGTGGETEHSSPMRRGTGNRSRRTSVHQNALRNTFHATTRNVGGSLEYGARPSDALERRSTDTKLKSAQEDEITRFASEKILPSSKDETSTSSVRPANLAVDATPDHSSLGNDDLSPTHPRLNSNSLAAKGKIKSFRSTIDDGSGEFGSTSVQDNRGNLKRKVSMIQVSEFIKPLF